jgi:hypothetical protein
VDREFAGFTATTRGFNVGAALAMVTSRLGHTPPGAAGKARLWLDLAQFEAVLLDEVVRRGVVANGALPAKLLADLGPAAAAAAAAARSPAAGTRAGGAAAALSEGELLSLRCAGAFAACQEAPLDEASARCARLAAAVAAADAEGLLSEAEAARCRALLDMSVALLPARWAALPVPLGAPVALYERGPLSTIDYPGAAQEHQSALEGSIDLAMVRTRSIRPASSHCWTMNAASNYIATARRRRALGAAHLLAAYPRLGARGANAAVPIKPNICRQP